MGHATKSDPRESIVKRHHPVGASTGYMQSLRGDWNAQVEEAWRVSSFAIELSALSESELPSLAEYLRQTPSLPFRYVSIHGPSKGRQMGEEQLVASLAQLSGLAGGIVMHPDTMDDLRLYRPLGHKLLLENMDSRKPDGRTPEELHRAFAELPRRAFALTSPMPGRLTRAWRLPTSFSTVRRAACATSTSARFPRVCTTSRSPRRMSVVQPRLEALPGRALDLRGSTPDGPDE